MSGYRSYAETEVREAILKGTEVWALDTGNAGEDDMLIGTHEECLAAVLHHHEIESLPDGWSLDRVDWIS